LATINECIDQKVLAPVPEYDEGASCQTSASEMCAVSLPTARQNGKRRI